MKQWPIGIWQLNISRYIQDWKPKLFVMLPQVSMSIFFWSYMLPRFRDIEGSTCPNNNFDQCPQIKKSDQKLHFSNVHNCFTIRHNELILFTGQQINIPCKISHNFETFKCDIFKFLEKCWNSVPKFKFQLQPHIPDIGNSRQRPGFKISNEIASREYLFRSSYLFWGTQNQGWRIIGPHEQKAWKVT